MDPPRTMNQKEARAILEANGWTMARGGKHSIKMTKPGELRPITLPMHKGAQYGRGLTASILREAGLK